ncbi:metal-binding protein [Thermocrinis sp.]
MALARSHELINLLALPGFFYFLPKEFYIPFGFGYLIGTFLLSPDLDLRHSKPSKRWGPLKILWYPYQKRSKHRGISHTPILGSFVRLFYVLLVITAVYYVIYFFSGYENLSKANPFRLLESVAKEEWLFYALLGLIASELMHLLVDILWSLRTKV